MKKPREQDLVRQCLDWLHLQGALAWRQNQGGFAGVNGNGKKRFVRFTHGEEGIADIIGCWRGRFLAVECKRPGEEPTPEQAYFLARAEAQGGIGLCVHTLDELIADLVGN